MSSDIFEFGNSELYQAEYVMIASWIAMAISGAFMILIYVLNARGLYVIAQRRGIKRPWLAWIPVGNYWLVGSISDNARLLKKGVVEKRRLLVLLLLGIPTAIGIVASVISMQEMLALFHHPDQMTLEEMLLELESVSNYYGIDSSASTEIALLALVLAAAEITGMVFYYMSLYELYASCRPRQRTVFLVLSIFLSLQPFFIFACRKYDEGMQPQDAGSLPPASPCERPWHGGQSDRERDI